MEDSFTLEWYCGSQQIELGLWWARSNVLIGKKQWTKKNQNQKKPKTKHPL